MRTPKNGIGIRYNVGVKNFQLPTFFPDATRGVIRSLDQQDLKKTGVEGIVVNTYHLLSQPGPSVLKSAGGVKKFMGWDGWVISDSGGFQMFSLIQKNKSLGTITDDGVTFHLGTKGGRKKYKISPEKCIQIQFDINPDIMICLDYFTPHMAKDDEIRLSVDLTISWAKRCKDEFQKQIKTRKIKDSERPKLFAVVQGGHDYKERERCAKELQSIGFDGYGYGGWPFDEENNFDIELTKYIPTLFPVGTELYGLGIGNPQALVDSVAAGWSIFDCVLPTRDARHKRLYIFTKDPARINNIFEATDWYGYVYPAREKYVRSHAPISEYCDCHTCKNYNLGYLNHLFSIDDSLAWRLATIHNLRMYTILIEVLRNINKK